MARRPQPKAKCTFCGLEFAKAGMTKHLSVCPQRLATIASANEKGGKSETLYHLRVTDDFGGSFWLDLEMRGSATLKELDKYLRAIWLECCGHMSEFYAGKAYTAKVGMSRTLASALQLSAELTHLYDFGSTTETQITLVASRTGVPTTKHPIVLLARNLMPEVKCSECDKSATHFCEECRIEHDEPGFLCDEHAETHPHDDYGDPMPLVNSPRSGVCGYEGPAVPPY